MTYLKNLLIIIAIVIIPCNSFAKNKILSFSYKLDNGMEIIVIPNKKTPVVSHMIWYKSGAIDEPIGKSGVAHLLEHMMFKATDKYASGQFSKLVARAGGNENAFTSFDFTAYYQTIAKDKLEMVMRLESARMKGLKFNEDEFFKERDVVVQERRTRVDNKPRSLLVEQIRASLFINNPYGIPLIGWKHEIENLSLSDVKNFYNNFYQPQNAVLIVAGDISADEVLILANKYYGNITNDIPITRNFTTTPTQVADKTIILQDGKVKQNEFMRYHQAESQNTGADNNAYALIVLSHILGQKETGRLYRRMVIEEKIAAQTRVFYDDLAIYDSIFGFYILPVNNKIEMTIIEKILEEEIKKIANNGVSEQELNRVKKNIEANTIFARENIEDLAYIYGQAYVLGQTSDYVENWDKEINSVSNDDLIRVCKETLLDKHHVSGYLVRNK